MKTPNANRDEVRESTFTVTATKAEKEAIKKLSKKVEIRAKARTPSNIFLLLELFC